MKQSALEKEFFELYDTEADALFRFAFFKVSDRDRAKDIVQESFVRMWEYLSTGKSIQNKRAFVFRIAGNIVIDQYRKKKELSLDGLYEAGFDAPDQVNDGAVMAGKIDVKDAVALLQDLPDAHREVVWLRMVEGWAVKDIAEYLKESENTISVRIHRGMKIWKEKILSIGKGFPAKTS